MSDTTTDSVTFHSGASNLRLVREPSRRRQLGEGNEYEVLAGKDYQFYDGVLVATKPDDITWLRDHDSCGKLFFEPGSENPQAQSSAKLQGTIMRLALSGDFTAIGDILVAERHSLSRPEVIAACEAAISVSGGTAPSVPDTPLHEVERVRMGPTAGITPGVSPDPVPGQPAVDPSTLTEPEGAIAAPSVPTPAAQTVPPSETPVQGAAPLPPAPTTPPEGAIAAPSVEGGAPGAPAS